MEQILDWIQAHPELVTNGVAGAILGPILSKLLRGGLTTGTLGGLLGGLAGGFGADQAGLNEVLASGDDASMLMTYLQNIVEGAIGGGILGGGGGVVAKQMTKK